MKKLTKLTEEQKQLVPTDLGKIVNKLLIENFGDIDFSLEIVFLG